MKLSPVKNDFTIVYLFCNEKQLRKRLTERGDSLKEQNKRIASDNEAFEDIEEYVDIVVDTADKTPLEVVEQIFKLGRFTSFEDFWREISMTSLQDEN